MVKDNIHRLSGFTLVEMMVALLIFSMLSVAGVLLLRSAVDGSEVTSEKLGDMAEMQRFVSLIEADLSQALPRTYRDAQGDRQPAFKSGRPDDEDGFLKFTSGGQSNVNNKSRSNLRRVSYRIIENTLERRHYEMTDGGEISEPAELLVNISNLQVRFRDKRGQWTNEWQSERLSDLPRAIEIQLDQDGRNYRHLFLVGAGYL